jgi:hypothetical protein
VRTTACSTSTLTVDRGLKQGHFRGEGQGQRELPGEVAER